jgi:DNA replication protein DnaC
VIVEAGGGTRARLCACRVRAAGRTGGVEAILEAAHIPPRYRECEFQNYAAYGDRSQVQSLEIARGVALRYAEEYPLDERGLMLMGPPGVGKTHLVVATLRRLMSDKGVGGLFCDVQDLLRQLQGTFDRQSGLTELELLQPVLNTEVVVLDDLGGRQFSPWLEETLAHIVTTRYNERKATLVTTNYLDDPKDPRSPTLRDRIGARVRSRLHEMCHLIRIEAQDFRQSVNLADYHRAPEPIARPKAGA